jgi:hypothetical protein
MSSTGASASRSHASSAASRGALRSRRTRRRSSALCPLTVQGLMLAELLEPDHRQQVGAGKAARRRKLDFVSWRIARPAHRRHCSATRLASPKMQQVRMNVVPASDFNHARLRHHALLENPMLLRRCPTTPPFRTRQDRHCRHMCPPYVPINVQVNGQVVSQTNGVRKVAFIGLHRLSITHNSRPDDGA